MISAELMWRIAVLGSRKYRDVPRDVSTPMCGVALCVSCTSELAPLWRRCKGEAQSCALCGESERWWYQAWNFRDAVVTCDKCERPSAAHLPSDVPASAWWASRLGDQRLVIPIRNDYVCSLCSSVGNGDGWRFPEHAAGKAGTFAVCRGCVRRNEQYIARRKAESERAWEAITRWRRPTVRRVAMPSSWAQVLQCTCDECGGPRSPDCRRCNDCRLGLLWDVPAWQREDAARTGMGEAPRELDRVAADSRTQWKFTVRWIGLDETYAEVGAALSPRLGKAGVARLCGMGLRDMRKRAHNMGIRDTETPSKPRWVWPKRKPAVWNEVEYWRARALAMGPPPPAPNLDARADLLVGKGV